MKKEIPYTVVCKSCDKYIITNVNPGAAVIRCPLCCALMTLHRKVDIDIKHIYAKIDGILSQVLNGVETIGKDQPYKTIVIDSMKYRLPDSDQVYLEDGYGNRWKRRCAYFEGVNTLWVFDLL